MQTITELLTDYDDFIEIEKLRREVFDIHFNSGTYYLNNLIYNKKKAIATKKDNEIIAGCYFHSFLSDLVIDVVFVKEEYQGSGLKLGRRLILDILNHKKKIENILHTKLYTSSIDPIDEKAEALYKKIGYRYGNNNTGVMHIAL